MTTKIQLKKPDKKSSSDNCQVIQWSKALPFFKNSRGLLIHRVESVTTYVYPHRSHIAVTYLCNNSTTSEGEFLAVPPKDRLVCESCELMAKRKRKPSADELVGHHVHIGHIRVERSCCRDKTGTN